MRLYGGVRMLDRPSIPNIRRLDAGAMPMIQAMNTNGIRIDPAHFSALDTTLAEVEEACRTEIRTLMRGEVEWPEFNPASPDQVAELLFLRMGLRPPGRPRKTQGGRFTTDDDMLAALKPLHPIAGAIADFREIRKLRTTYTGPIPRLVDEDGRVRTVFKATRTATGRLASGDKRRGYPNLQNIPVRGDWGREIRNGFVASDGCVLVSHDLSQIEMRDAAHLSGDPAMARIFRDGLDIHTFTAIALFRLLADEILGLIARDAAGTATEQDKVALAEFRHRYRLPAKTCGFGILYGLTAEGLQTRIMADGGPVLDVAECQRYIDGWFAAYPAIKKWMELQYYRARRYGMVWDLFGRIRPTPGVHSAITRVQEEALREAGNMPIQSTAQGHIKLAMAEFMPLVEYYESRGELCRPILQVHDELIHEVGEGIADEFCAMGQEIMRRSVPLNVPVESSADKAHSWGAMK